MEYKFLCPLKLFKKFKFLFPIKYAIKFIIITVQYHI